MAARALDSLSAMTSGDATNLKRVARLVGLVLASILFAAACSQADAGDTAISLPPTATPVVVIPISTPVPAEPSVPVVVTPETLVPDEPERLDTLFDPSAPPLCLALIPTHPGDGATGSVAYAFSPETIEFEYQSLYVVNYVGGSALVAGLPGVRTGDQFTFLIDDAMEIETGDPKIVTSLPDGSQQPCAIRWVPGETVEAIDGASVGY